MAHIYRLTCFCLFVFFTIASGYSQAAVPKASTYSVPDLPKLGSFSDYQSACSAVLSYFNSAWSSSGALGNIESCTSSGVVVFRAGVGKYQVGFFSSLSCPANSTASGSQCACNAGFEEKDGQCKAPLSDLDKCAAWNDEFNSMPQDDRPTDADGYRPIGVSSACFDTDYDSFNPRPSPLSPGKGCVMNFDREIAWQNRDDPSGKWWSRGKFSTVSPQVCDLTEYSGPKDPPKDDACPSGYEKSKYADVCIPLEEKPANCPPGYEESQYVKGICIPEEQKPDPFDPDPTNPKGPGPYDPKPDGSCDPGYVRDGASCYKDPKPKQPDPTDPKQPGPGDSCPEGYSKNASGMCTKDTFTPGPGIPCPTGYSKNASGACEKDAPPSCPPGEERNSEGLCVPKPCEPDPKWPEKCTACEKDALNPLVCKDDPGKCVPDPAIPDKCKGTGDGEEGSFGGTCEAGFTCKGDVIQCAIAKEQHIRACKLFDTKNAESQLYDKEKGKEGDQTKDLKGNENINMANRIDTSDAFGGGGSGVQDLNITVMGQSITLPFSKINSGLDALGRVLVAVSFLIALRIVGRG